MNNILLFFIVIVQNNIFQFKIGNFYTKEVYSISKEGKKKEQKVPKVNVLFKQTSKDMKLYTTVKGQGEQSEFLKELQNFTLNIQKIDLKNDAK